MVMNLQTPLLFLALLLITACNNESVTPGDVCEKHSSHSLTSNTVQHAYVYASDGQTIVPLDELKVFLSSQFFNNTFVYDERLHPYSRYDIDYIELVDAEHAKLYYEDSIIQYTYTQKECVLNFSNGSEIVHAELSDNGKDILIQRYAIYRYEAARIANNRFVFVEFRDKGMKSPETVALEFMADHPDIIDTIGMDLVISKSEN